jgi:hypothetical protein
MLQHTDSKSEQQRLVCSDEPGCAHPIAMINDLGLTFGRASELNRNAVASANFREWSRTPVWSGDRGCTANITRSYTGTLDHPRIGDEGRRFLAALLGQLSDAQLVDLFTVARFDARPDGGRAPASIAEWVDAFKSKRDAIASRRCDN